MISSCYRAEDNSRELVKIGLMKTKQHNTSVAFPNLSSVRIIYYVKDEGYIDSNAEHYIA